MGSLMSTNTKRRICGWPPFDEASRTRGRICLTAFVGKVIVMVVILILIAIYDSNHPVTTVTSNNDLPFSLPVITMQVPKIDPLVSFEPRCALFKNNFKVPLDCPYDTAFSVNDYDPDPAHGSITFKNEQAYPYIVELILNISNCGVADTSELVPEPAITFFVNDLHNDFSSDSQLVAPCGSMCHYSVRTLEHVYGDGKKIVEHVALSLGQSGVLRNKTYLRFTFETHFTRTVEETPFGLAKRITTDAGGLLAIVTLFVLVCEMIAVRVYFPSPDHHYPFLGREMVLWLTETDKRGTQQEIPKADIVQSPQQ